MRRRKACFSIEEIGRESGLAESELNAALSRLIGRGHITIDAGLNWTRRDHVHFEEVDRQFQ